MRLNIILILVAISTVDYSNQTSLRVGCLEYLLGWMREKPRLSSENESNNPYEEEFTQKLANGKSKLLESPPKTGLNEEEQMGQPVHGPLVVYNNFQFQAEPIQSAMSPKIHKSRFIKKRKFNQSQKSSVIHNSPYGFKIGTP